MTRVFFLLVSFFSSFFFFFSARAHFLSLFLPMVTTGVKALSIWMKDTVRWR